jgi:hypothetical protein
MSRTDDLLALQQAALSVRDMREALSQHREGVAALAADAGDLTDRIATTEVRQEGFYWVILGQPPGDSLLGARRVVAGGRFQAVAPGGGDRRQRTAGVQATVGAGRMMIRGDWRDFRDDPPSGPPHGAGSGSATRRPSTSHRARAVIGTIGILIVFVVVIGFVVLAVFYLHR